MPPLEFALDATPAVQTEHCAADHNGSNTITKEKSILLMFFIRQIYKTFNIIWASPFGSGFTLQLRTTLAGFSLQSLTQCCALFDVLSF